MFDWFKGKKKTGSTRFPERTLNQEDASAELARAGFKCYDFIVSGIEVDGIDKKNNGNVYEIYRSKSRSTALSFLNAIPAGRITSRHYVIVETPDGNVGKDTNGIFDE